MMLNRQTEIAIDVLVACARARGKLLTASAVAEDCRATRLHAAQIISRLTRLGWLDAQRGRGGGITMAPAADTLSLADVVQEFSPQPPTQPTRSNLRALIAKAEKQKINYLRNVKIKDLIT
jgi:Rrf2 family transcriptional regulator, nitric oxide-sensitive transcriptional repressor